jgi:hypothetical protein
VWQYVIPHFNAFLKELELSPKDRKDAEGKAERIAHSLFAKYYPGRLVFDPSCYIKVGSYGKGTAAACDTDLDMLFLLRLKCSIASTSFSATSNRSCSRR